ncbi:MAG: nitroreductase [Zhengella sp.]|uniref:nitroreductase family protein n=1 Tax=Zhengella sp. TaxID=2282762 RepID=UPI001DFD2E62|nr:nitroreductase [Notoacmeibacter sp.]MCC0027056.1 nitroreductase [Brucellaceae bacterium]
MLKEPGPDGNEIETMIRIAARVPDHGKLQPWRFILYRGDMRHRVGELLAGRLEERDGPLTPGAREKELERFTRAPLVIGVISCPRESDKIPQWEMFLSAGAACMNLVHAAHALGFGANWITNWYSEDAEARRLLGLKPEERVAGFVHVGTVEGTRPDRPRPEPADVMSDYSGPEEA